MPRHCCVPGCKSNYNSQKGYVSIFLFPKDVNLKQCWVSAIPRKDFTPSKYSAVCSAHFQESDIIKYDIYPLPNGAIQRNLLKFPKLMKNAVPSIFPKYLSKSSVSTRTDADERRQKQTFQMNRQMSTTKRTNRSVKTPTRLKGHRIYNAHLKNRLLPTAVPSKKNSSSDEKHSAAKSYKKTSGLPVGNKRSRKHKKQDQSKLINDTTTENLLKFPKNSSKITNNEREDTVNKLDSVCSEEPEVRDFENDNKFEVLYLKEELLSTEEINYSDNEEFDTEQQEKEQVPIIFQCLCMVCLATSSLMPSTKSLIDLYVHITKIQVEDGLPKYMCADCIQKLVDISKFIEMAKQSDENIKRRMLGHEEIKMSISGDDNEEKTNNIKVENSSTCQEMLIVEGTSNKSESTPSKLNERSENKFIDKKDEEIYNDVMCWTCGVLYVGVTLPKMISNAPSSNIKFQCLNCLQNEGQEKKPPDNLHSINDQKVNSGNVERKIRCVCSKDIPLSQYIKHQLEEHRIEKRFRCMECLLNFPNQELLTQHSRKHFRLKSRPGNGKE